VGKIMSELSPLQIDPKDLLWRPGFDSFRSNWSGIGEFVKSIRKNTEPHYKIKFVGKPASRELYAVFYAEKFVKSERVLFFGAHDDDLVLAGGRNIQLAQGILGEEDYATVTGTITNGENRDPLRYPPFEHANDRLQEAMIAEPLSGTSLYANFGIKDGTVIENFGIVLDRFGQLIKAVKPVVIFAPHPSDKHSDHRGVYLAALFSLFTRT
jgi:hypothetical protein